MKAALVNLSGEFHAIVDLVNFSPLSKWCGIPLPEVDDRLVSTDLPDGVRFVAQLIMSGMDQAQILATVAGKNGGHLSAAHQQLEDAKRTVADRILRLYARY